MPTIGDCMRVISKFNLDAEMGDLPRFAKSQFDRMAANLLRKIGADCKAEGRDVCDPETVISETAEKLFSDLTAMARSAGAVERTAPIPEE